MLACFCCLLFLSGIELTNSEDSTARGRNSVLCSPTKKRMDRKLSSRDVEKVNMWGGTLKAQ
jgi:hypothetical protein